MLHRFSGFRFLLLLSLIVVSALSLPATALKQGSPFPRAASAADDHNGNGHGNGNGNGNNGNGNGNNGNNGNSGNKKDKEEKEKKAKKDKGNVTSEPVEEASLYTIDVSCEYQAVDDHTTCRFAGTALEGAKKVDHLVVPADALCAPVLGGDAGYVDPDPNAHVTGYRSPGSTAAATLVLSGTVTTSGTATYWFKSGGNVFPMSGPGLACMAQAASTATAAPTEAVEPTEPAVPVPTEPSTPIPTPTPDVTDSTGDVLVQIYTCPIAAETADYDWYGACTPVGAGHTFLLAPYGGPENPGSTMATSEQGQAQFGDLAPGTYTLTLVDEQWCHAESDGVDADGNVIVKAGARTTVWIFQCTGGSS